MHEVYWSFLDGQTWPGAFAENFPFLLSITCAIAGGVMQGKAESRLMAANPELYPPRPSAFVLSAFSRWRKQRRDERGARKESLLRVLRTEFAALRSETRRFKQVHGFKWASNLTGIDRSSCSSRSFVSSPARTPSSFAETTSVPPPDVEAVKASAQL